MAAANEMPSAIALPDASPERASSPNAMKRRRSEEFEDQDQAGGKRQRTNGDGAAASPPPPAQDNNDAAPTPIETDQRPTSAGTPSTHDASSHAHSAPLALRKTGMGDEKQRSKRLFGALLGNLNQKDSGSSKRRQQIEERRKAELARQDEERAEAEARKREEAMGWRRKAQGRIEEDEMRIRHRNMIERANFLLTEAEPRVYYRPWDLRSEEEGRIQQQISDTQSIIDREVEEFEARREGSRTAEDGNEARPTTTCAGANGNVGNGTPQEEEKGDAAAQDPAKSASATTNNELDDNNDADTKPADIPASSDVTDPTSHAKPAEEEADREDEHIIEGDEDMVIY